MFLESFALLVVTLCFPPLFYYLWIKNKANLSWGFKPSEDYKPTVTLIIATYNEAAVIRSKLENVQNLNYPEHDLQVIVIDSNSTDGTLKACKEYLTTENFKFSIRLISEKVRLGKSHALNTALKVAEGELIALSDADSFWDKNALLAAVSYFADPSVGAITGRERISNLEESVHTMSEGLYRDFYYTLRLGESKIYSTLIFQGELSLYRRVAFDKFEDRPGYSDDTGTVINIISNGYRCIFVPDATFQDTTAFSLSGRLNLKSRRAQHLIAGLFESIHLKINGKLPIPWLIVLFNLYLHVLSPLIFFSILFFSVFVFIIYFPLVWFLPILILAALLLKKIRVFSISYITSNIALIIGLSHHLTKKRSLHWQKIEEMRK